MAKRVAKTDKASKKGKVAAAVPVPVLVPKSDSSDSDSSSSESDSDSDSDDAASTSKGADKGKGKSKAGLPARPSSKYQPPKDLAAVKGLTGRSSVDWDTIAQNKKLQLWAVRVPHGVKPKHLDGLKMMLPTALASSAAPLASFTAKKAGFDIFLADAAPSAGGKRKRDDGDDEKAAGVGGGEEMRQLVPLLPKRAGGDRLFQAPRPLTRHLIITRSLPTTVLSHLPSATSSLIASQPSPVPGAILSAAELLDPTVVQAKKITRVQPAGLKFRLALGGQGAVGGQGNFHSTPPPPRPELIEAVTPDEDVEMQAVEDVPASPKKVKKEKREGESPKKKRVKKEALDA